MLMEDWFFSSPHGLPGILQTDTNNLILWEKRGKTVWFAFPPPSPSWLCLKSSGNFCEKKLSYCVGSAGYQRSFPEDCYAPGWCAGHCEQEREVMMEKFCRGGPGGKAENDSTSCKDQRDLCSSLCSSLCWIIYLTQEEESEYFFSHFLFQEEDIVWNLFCMISGKIKHSIGRAGSNVLGTPLCG